MDTAPVLVSARLRLRPHLQSDQEVWFRLLRYGGMWPLQGYGFWVFEDRVTGEFLGEGGLMYAMRAVLLHRGRRVAP